MKHFKAQNWYELLEVAVDASPEQIEAAAKRMMRVFADDNVALYGLVEADEAQLLRLRIKQAASTLCNAPMREAYHRSLGLSAPGSAVQLTLVHSQEAVVAEAKPLALTQVHRKEAEPTPGPEIAATVEPSVPKPRQATEAFVLPNERRIDGAVLREARVHLGLTLEQLSARTRISTKHLEHLEGEEFGSLPAAVYLRGMLLSVARELGLDAAKVAKDYFERLK
jgi:AraC-like DNA-binding protein